MTAETASTTESPLPSTAALPRAHWPVAVVARFTVREAVNRRVIVTGLALSAAFLVLYAVGYAVLTNALESNIPDALTATLASSTLVLLGLYAVQFLAAFLAFFLAVGAISTEVDSGLLHAVIARPVRRAEYLLGRWLAMCGMLMAYVVVMMAGVLGVSWLIAGYTAANPVAGTLLVLLESVLLLTLGLLGSSMFSTVGNGLVLCSLFGLAWVAGIIGFVGAVIDNGAMQDVATAVSLIEPSDGLWRGASYFFQTPDVTALLRSTGSFGIPLVASVPPAVGFVLWSVACTGGFLAATVRRFSRRDL